MDAKRTESPTGPSHTFASWILLVAGAASLMGGCATESNSGDSSRGGGLASAIAEAERFGHTAEGIRYFQAFSPYGRVLEVAANQCAPAERHVSTASDFVFYISADGRIAKVLSTNPNASICATVALRNVRVPPPPKPGWIIHLSVAIGLS
jgi:hypothetical protein